MKDTHRQIDKQIYRQIGMIDMIDMIDSYYRYDRQIDIIDRQIDRQI